jgi:hypothetical protein
MFNALFQQNERRVSEAVEGDSRQQKTVQLYIQALT